MPDEARRAHGAVVLAGGASSRMGEPKALLPFRGRPWIEAQLAQLARAGGAWAVVVIAGLERHRAALTWLELAHRRWTQVGPLSVRVLEQPRPEDGPFASLRLGLSTVLGSTHDSARPVFVWPVDVPACVSTLHALAEALGPHDAAIPRSDGRRGHPVLVSPSFAARLAATTQADARLDHELARAACVEVPTEDPGVRRNLNTPDEWRAWVSSPEARCCYPPLP